MKKQKIQLIVILAVLVLAIASYFLLSHYNKKTEEDESTDDYTILTVDTTDVTEIKVTSEEEAASDTAADAASASTEAASTDDASADTGSTDAAALSSTDAEPVYEEKDVLDLVNDGDTWYLASDKSLNLDQTSVKSMLADVEKMTSDKQITNVTDFDQYGLDHPSLTIVVTTSDGTDNTIRIGDYNESAGMYYVRINDDTEVYLIDSTLNTAFNIDSSTLVSTDSSDSSDSAASAQSIAMDDSAIADDTAEESAVTSAASASTGVSD